MNLRERLEYLFFPWDASCVSCRGEETEPCGLCRACLRTLTPISAKTRCEKCLDPVPEAGLCAECLNRPPAFERLYASYEFSGLLRKLLLDFKFHNKRYLKRVFARMAADALPRDVLSACAYLVPVPISRARKRRRGYNQAALLAQELSRLCNIPVREDLLTRKDGKMKTSLLNREERRKAVHKQYAAAGKLNGETVLLIDDVCTTGETLRACADALVRAGAGKVYGYTVARTDRK